MIARWSCGNEEKRNGFWKAEEEKRCCICGVEERCIEHIMFHTRIKIEVGAVLDERGKGEVLKWMREVRKLREIYRKGTESVSVVKSNCKPSSLSCKS